MPGGISGYSPPFGRDGPDQDFVLLERALHPFSEPLPPRYVQYLAHDFNDEDLVILVLPDTLGRFVILGGQAAEGYDQFVADLSPQGVANRSSGRQFGWQENLD